MWHKIQDLLSHATNFTSAFMDFATENPTSALFVQLDYNPMQSILFSFICFCIHYIIFMIFLDSDINQKPLSHK